MAHNCSQLQLNLKQHLKKLRKRHNRESYHGNNAKLFCTQKPWCVGVIWTWEEKRPVWQKFKIVLFILIRVQQLRSCAAGVIVNFKLFVNADHARFPIIVPNCDIDVVANIFWGGRQWFVTHSTLTKWKIIAFYIFNDYSWHRIWE